MKLLWVAMGVLPASGPATAQTMSGNFLYDACNQDNVDTPGFCAGYISGMLDGMRYGIAIPFFTAGVATKDGEIDEVSDKLLMYCPPDTVKVKQNVEIVKNYLRDNPAERNDHPRGLIHVAMAKAYPCP